MDSPNVKSIHEGVFTADSPEQSEKPYDKIAATYEEDNERERG